jgi:transketolase
VELFEEQDAAYRKCSIAVKKNTIKRPVVEAGTTFGWHKYGTEGDKCREHYPLAQSAPGGGLDEGEVAHENAGAAQ